MLDELLDNTLIVSEMTANRGDRLRRRAIDYDGDECGRDRTSAFEDGRSAIAIEEIGTYEIRCLREGKLFFFDYGEVRHFIYMVFERNMVSKILKQKKRQNSK